MTDDQIRDTRAAFEEYIRDLMSESVILERYPSDAPLFAGEYRSAHIQGAWMHYLSGYMRRQAADRIEEQS